MTTATTWYKVLPTLLILIACRVGTTDDGYDDHCVNCNILLFKKIKNAKSSMSGKLRGGGWREGAYYYNRQQSFCSDH